MLKIMIVKIFVIKTEMGKLKDLNKYNKFQKKKILENIIKVI